MHQKESMLVWDPNVRLLAAIKEKKKNGERSDSDGDPDEETPIKRQFPRTFHS